MKRQEWWDWPPTRRRRYYRADYQPSGWSLPVARKAVRVYWRVTITLIKMLISIPLALMAIGSTWFLWILVMLFVSKA
jgi:hypothetical protein